MLMGQRSRPVWPDEHNILSEHSYDFGYEPAQICMSAETTIVYGGVQPQGGNSRLIYPKFTEMFHSN